MTHCVAGIEIGGTTCIAAIGEKNNGEVVSIKERYEINTTTPAETFDKIGEWLKSHEFSAIGIASFGPVNLNRNDSTYGYITTTPKPNWGQTAVVSYFQKLFPNCPIGFDTDVNAPALCEVRYGGHGNITSACYITLGTGVGVGICVDGQPVHGMMHPEVGHIRVPLHPTDIAKRFNGLCPYHENCVEGMVCSGAIAARAGVARTELSNIADTHEVWEIMTHYLAHLCANLALTVSPQVIVIGGGMAKRRVIFSLIQKQFTKLINGYIPHPTAESYIKPSFHLEVGLVSSLELAIMAEEEAK